MAHWQQIKFVELAHRHFLADGRTDRKVLEVGSYNVNGSVRDLFKDWTYIGADLVEGPGVDVISPGHKLAYADGFFDVAMSCECFEHDEHWKQTFMNMHRMTASDGLVIVTCASKGRFEHGTRRTNRTSSPGTWSTDYYRNLTAKDFAREMDLPAMFATWEFFYAPVSHDLYFVGFKGSKADTGAFRRDVQSEVIDRDERSVAKKLFDLPVVLTSNLLPDEQFQSVVYTAKRLTGHRQTRRQ